MNGPLRHTRRKAIIGGLLAAAVAATALTACASPQPGGTAPSAGPSLSTLGETPQQLAGGWQVVAAGDRLLDRARNAYVPLNLPPDAILDPTGRRHAVGGGSLRVADVTGGKVITVDRYMMLGFYRGLIGRPTVTASSPRSTARTPSRSASPWST